MLNSKEIYKLINKDISGLKDSELKDDLLFLCALDHVKYWKNWCDERFDAHKAHFAGNGHNHATWELAFDNLLRSDPDKFKTFRQEHPEFNFVSDDEVKRILDIASDIFYGHGSAARAASRTDLPSVAFEFLVDDPGWKVRQSLAKNPTTPVNFLIKLSKDQDHNVKKALTNNKNVPVEALMNLANDADPTVRAAAAASHNVTIEVLEILIKDSFAGTLLAVAQNPETPVEILVKLAKNDNWLIRSEIAANPKTPIETLIELSKDSEHEVRDSAKKQDRLPKEPKPLPNL